MAEEDNFLTKFWRDFKTDYYSLKLAKYLAAAEFLIGISGVFDGSTPNDCIGSFGGIDPWGCDGPIDTGLPLYLNKHVDYAAAGFITGIGDAEQGSYMSLLTGPVLTTVIPAASRLASAAFKYGMVQLVDLIK